MVIEAALAVLLLKDVIRTSRYCAQPVRLGAISKAAVIEAVEETT